MLKTLAKRTIRKLGFDLLRHSFQTSNRDQIVAMLRAHRINLVFDVGANVGQFGKELRETGYLEKIVSFEPMSKAREELQFARRKDPLWLVAPQAAIGDFDGEIEINVAGNSQSSSILHMLDSHANAAPESRYIGSELVPIHRLDTFASHYLSPDTIPFLKVDTQGYEDRVLRGAHGIIDRIAGIQLELSLVPLYEGQRLYKEMIEELNYMGFELWGVSPVFVDPRAGRLLQVDATFFREALSKSLQVI